MNNLEGKRERHLILVADDDPMLRRLAHSFLTLGGYDIVEAADGRQALEVFHSSRPDAVVTDIVMPEMDGLSFCRELRALPGGEDVPVLVMTSLDDSHSIELAFAAGATGFICKPIPWPVLGHHLKYMLRTSDAFLALRKSEAENRLLSHQLETLLHAVDDAVLIYGPDLAVEWVNRSAAKLFDSEAAAMVGHPCSRNDSDASCDCAVARSFSTGVAERTEYASADGIREIRTYPVTDHDGTVRNVIEFITDITEKVAHQAETLRAGQLAALGELAAGVAHEINNPINGIINYAQLLVNRLGAETKEQDIASRIIGEGDRVAEIVRGLLSFARDRREERTSCRLADIVGDSLALTRAQLRKDGISVQTDLPEDLPNIRAHHQQIEQVVLNLISNARYALNARFPGIDDRKSLSLQAEPVAVGEKQLVRFIVRDNGTGIPATTCSKVMTPFFTTKPSGEGTGLGLSISRNIVESHGGRIVIESTEGEFTQIIVELPTEGA